MPFGVPDLLRLDWGGVSGGTWVALVVSGLPALSVAHIIWYTGVKRIGSARTSVYGNLVPVAAMAVAFLWLQEPIGAVRLASGPGPRAGSSGVRRARWASHGSTARRDEIRRFLDLGVSKTAIAKLTGVSRTALYSFMSTRGLRPRP